MADRIRVRSEWLDSCASELKAIENAVRSAQSTLSGITLSKSQGGDLNARLNISLSLTGSRFSGSNARDDVQALSRAAQALSVRIGQLSNAAGKAARVFEEVENSAVRLINGNATGGTSQVYKGEGGASGFDAAIITALGYPKDPRTWSDKMRQEYDDFVNNATTYVDSEGRRVIVSDETTIICHDNGNITVTEAAWNQYSEKTYGADGSYVEDSGKVKTQTKTTLDKVKPDDIKHWNSDGAKKYEGPQFGNTIAETGGEISHSYSILHGEVSSDDGFVSGTASYDIGKATWTAGAFAGFYQMKKGPKGEEVKVFSPGIRAELGGSVSTIEATASTRIGSDNLAANFSATAKGPSASALISSEVGWINGQPAAHIGASAEAIGGEISGTAGVEVMGVKGNVKGSLNYGIGAHADVGAHDGKITCDVGLSVGVGASLKFEVDYGGAVDRVLSKAGEAIKEGKKAVKALDTLIKSARGRSNSLLKLF